MPETIALKVTGMTCDHCVHAVAVALQGVPGVRSATVSLEEGVATVFGEGLDAAKLINAVEEEGYEAAVR